MRGIKIVSTHRSQCWEAPADRSIFEVTLDPVLPELEGMDWYCPVAENGPFSTLDAELAGYDEKEIEKVFLLTAEHSPEALLGPDLIGKFARFILPAYKLLAGFRMSRMELLERAQGLIDMRLAALFRGEGSLAEYRQARDQFIADHAKLAWCSYDWQWLGIYSPDEDWIHRIAEHVRQVGESLGGVKVQSCDFWDEERRFYF